MFAQINYAMSLVELKRAIGILLQSEQIETNRRCTSGLDQLMFMRPIAGFGEYQTPIENLYLCGAGTHPGGGVTGVPGYNAARTAVTMPTVALYKV